MDISNTTETKEQKTYEGCMPFVWSNP